MVAIATVCGYAGYLNRVTGSVDVVSTRDDLQHISRGASASFDGHLFFAQHPPSASSTTLVKQSLHDGSVVWRLGVEAR